MPRLTRLISACIGALLLLPLSTLTSANSPQENALVAEPAPAPLAETYIETVALVDVSALAQEFEDRGTMTLVVAGKERVLELHEHEIFASGGRTITTFEADGNISVVGEVTARALQGHVQGVPSSSAFITLDAPENALLGTVYVENRAYHLRTETALAIALLKSTWIEADTRPLPISNHGHGDAGAISAASATYTTTIRVVGDSYYAGTGWTTRVTDAFNQQHAMWDRDVWIHQTLRFSTMPHYSTYDSGELVDHFKSYVAAGIRDGYYFEDSYQLFAANDMAHPDEIVGVGNAIGDYEARIPFGTLDMVSIVEGWDHNAWDSYDPYNTYHLGMVSATELGHNYGEWDHPEDCRDLCTSYNVMASGIAIPFRGFWFTGESVNRITKDSWPQL